MIPAKLPRSDLFTLSEPDKDKLIVHLMDTIDGLLAQVFTLTEKVEKLERQLARNSENSSKPPSSDGLAKKRQRPVRCAASPAKRLAVSPAIKAKRLSGWRSRPRRGTIHCRDNAAAATAPCPGIALSAEQISHLTSDIVWMETQTVVLPDGTVETVLAPKVYLAHARGAIAGGNVNLEDVQARWTIKYNAAQHLNLKVSS